VQALLVTPGTAGSARVAEMPAARAAAGEVLLRALEVGVCGTDSEIAHGLFGVAPEGEEHLVLGHELLGEVVEGAGPFRPGDLVAATVRRSCGRCAACAAGSPDACLTGLYRERGITSLHGFASELAAESPEHLIPIPTELGRLGVLAEPSSITARGIRHARAVGARQPWELRRALVLGSGAIGTLATLFLRLDGYEVWTASREAAGSEKAALVELSGARYVSTTSEDVDDLALEVSGFDLVVEATGDAAVMARSVGLLGRNGVALLLGLDPRPGTVEIGRATLGVDVVVQNRAVVGSVNAHRDDWRQAVRNLTALRERWPEAAERIVGLRVDPGRFEDALRFRGVKATLRFA
jgi:threonine dehydrogenase-like Zn-dependent dehydrogenase